MFRLSSVFLVIALMLWPMPGSAQSPGYAGQWQQVASNAGACDRCRISVTPFGAAFKVSGNNGWSAIVEAERSDTNRSLSGVGRWDRRAGAIYGGMQFSIRLTLIERQLFMTMRLRMEDGSQRAVQAIFEPLSTPQAEPPMPNKA